MIAFRWTFQCVTSLVVVDVNPAVCPLRGGLRYHYFHARIQQVVFVIVARLDATTDVIYFQYIPTQSYGMTCLGAPAILRSTVMIVSLAPIVRWRCLRYRLWRYDFDDYNCGDYS